MSLNFRNLTIISKIAVPATIVAVVSIGIVLYASLAVTHLSDTATALVDENATRVQLALQAESSFNSAAVSEKNVILSPDEKMAKTNIELYDKAIVATLKAIDSFDAITPLPDQRALADTFRTAVGNRRKASAHVFELAIAGKTAEAFAYSTGEAAPFRRIAIEAVGKLIALNVEKMRTARDASIVTAEGTRAWLVVGAAAGLVCAFGILGWIALYQISKPLARMTREMAKLAAGDLDIQIEGAQRADEIGGLARSLQVFRENAVTARRLEAEQQEEHLRKEARRQALEGSITEFDEQVREALDTLTAASTEMHATAESMAATAEETSRQATAVAATSDEASANVQTVAAATEELHSSINEISRQVTQSAEIANTAVVEADRTNATIQGLAATAQKIGEVVTLIQSIASQTNLLALNATIEAARAGEAGKGFAVVASEVKALANQTAKATEDISAQITAIQGETGHAVEAIRGIGGTIRHMNEIASAIAAAVEQQGAATRDIAQNIQSVARGTAEVSANVAGVNQAADETGSAATQVLQSADELGRQADKLRTDVSGFFAKIRAG
ncbi:MAG: methyl-accepting chemotaxis protein [Rhodospirillales bacterium]|nr:methyl-accepting chemotaxis protein [Rhodospirillales bacterium]